jgi:hypothetical protein
MKHGMKIMTLEATLSVFLLISCHKNNNSAAIRNSEVGAILTPFQRVLTFYMPTDLLNNF